MDLFKKKPICEIKDGSFKEQLDIMREKYREKPLKFLITPKPDWMLWKRNDPLGAVFRDKKTILQHGQIYLSYLVQANVLLFDRRNLDDHPALILYSTHPIAEKYPELLLHIGMELYYYKGMPEEAVPEQLREVVRLITDEYDHSSMEFSISMTDPDDPDVMIEDIDMHLCTVYIFRKDLPSRILRGRFLPVIAAPDLTPAVLILPKKYWTARYYD